MNQENRIQHQIASDFKVAREKYALYEKFYLGLSKSGKIFLATRSREYKKILKDIQDIILPVIHTNCGSCSSCCQLCAPELSIYQAGAVGGFDCVDYLLVRCGTPLPDPIYENTDQNRCPFWSDGCILPLDCRSYSCIQFYCETVEKSLDMNTVSRHVKRAEILINDFPFTRCMG